VDVTPADAGLPDEGDDHTKRRRAEGYRKTSPSSLLLFV
jgi:hypothetical protein